LTAKVEPSRTPSGQLPADSPARRPANEVKQDSALQDKNQPNKVVAERGVADTIASDKKDKGVPGEFRTKDAEKKTELAFAPSPPALSGASSRRRTGRWNRGRIPCVTSAAHRSTHIRS